MLESPKPHAGLASLARPGRLGDRRSPGAAYRATERGQSVVELAIIVPVLMFLFLAIADFARLYTTMLTVEAAAREAADFGTLYPWNWDGDPADPTSNVAKTVEGMEDRACIAASNLSDYVGPDDACSNPSFAYDLDEAPAGVAEDACDVVPRTSTPCNVVVTLTYDFRLIVPVSIPFFGGSLGFPSTLTFDRTSVFAISDFEIDEPLAPTPTPTP
jgi:Flp pilus assembly protein TadG